MPHYETPTHELQQTIIPHCFPHEAQPPCYYRSRPWGGPIPQVSFAIAHFTSRLSIVLPLQGNLIHIF